MNTAELLDQFVAESRECLERVGRRLLEVERDPGNAELLNDLFRAVHTLKGNSGLFEFKALERLAHAGEDLLDRVRDGRLAYGPALADVLLQAADELTAMVEAIGERGRLPDDAMPRAEALARALRSHLGDEPAQAAPADAAAAPAAPPAPARPGWLDALPATLATAGRVAVRYQPEADCFFRGEDPWHLLRTLPGLLHLDVAPAEPWPAAAEFDCYRCNLVLVAVSEAPLAAVQDHLRYCSEQLQACTIAEAAADVDDPALEPLRSRALQLWDEQRTLLTRAAPAPAAVDAARLVLSRLAVWWKLPADALPEDAAALAAWAAAQRPGGAAPLASAAAAPATAEAPRPVAAEEAPPPAAGTRVLKVAQDKVDRLMELVGEMVVAKNALPYLAERAENVFAQRELAREIKAQYAVIDRIALDLQHAMLQVRMLPVGTVFQRFGRLVRDLSRKLGKDVQLVIEGEDTEADKNLIESLADPLIHIVRNSLDHGLETPDVRRAAGKPPQGTLRVRAGQEGDRVVLEISDDGAGIDAARVRAKAVERGLIPADRAESLTEHEAQQLVFLPGFSTAETVSDLSGRGVGMDVVRTAVERVNGTVALESRRGQGTTVRLSLPLSMAVTHVMQIAAAGRRFGVPMDLIVETVRLPAEDIHHFKGTQTAVLRGRIVPLKALPTLLGLDEPPQLNADGEHAVLVVRIGGETLGLVIDDFHGTSDVILKPLEGVLAGITGFAGTALLGDGSVLMVLNPKELV